MSIDRASVTANAILCVLYKVGFGATARAEILRILRDEFTDVARTTVSETRHREEEE